MSGSGAGEALAARATAALQALPGLGVYEGPPVQAAAPYAVIETGAESDWSHKSGAGRELRLAVTLHDRGERPARLRALVREAEAALEAVPAEGGGWTIVTLGFVRSRIVPPPRGAPNGAWAALIEYRARMLAA
jgi:hypothetical protein